jgi:hypothetical protein
VAALLDDAEVQFRRKAAEVLFELARKETSAPLRLALARDDDDTVRRWVALALTRLGEGASRTLELNEEKDPFWRRLAALALAESGDSRGEATLVGWWQSGELGFERARQVAHAFGVIRSRRAVVPLTRSLGDVRLRPHLAEALAAIGEPAARPALADAFANERYVPARLALANAVLALGGGAEIAPALVRFLGVPDTMPDGLAIAQKGGFLGSIGGPQDKDLGRLRRSAGSTIALSVSIPRGGRGEGARLIVRGRSRMDQPKVLRIGVPRLRTSEEAPIELDPAATIELPLDSAPDAREVARDLPPAFGAGAGRPLSLGLVVPEGVELTALAVVPLADELPPPPPTPWTPTDKDQSEDVVDDGT